MRKLVKALAVLLYKIMNRLFPLKKNLMVISSALGRSYAGNPKAIYETIVERGLDREKLDIIWFYDSTPHDIPGRHKQVRFRSLKYLYYMAVAGLWIFDARQPNFLRKRNGVRYLQTWHGTPLKKLGLDLDDVFMSGEESLEAYKEEFKKNAAAWDMLISQNPFSTEVFRRAFAFEGKILETGYPRNDILFRYAAVRDGLTDNKPDGSEEEDGFILDNCISGRKKTVEILKEKLGLPEYKKVILYAPTWRDDKINGAGIYKFDTSLDFDLMKEKLGDEYVIAVKYHYLVKDSIDWSRYEGFVYVYDEAADIAELMVAADILVTDYSSVMFDYAITGRPMYFYCPDIERYKNVLRGFYFDFEATSPGPVILTSKELCTAVKTGSDGYYKEYGERYDAFVKTYLPWDDGSASDKVIRGVMIL